MGRAFSELEASATKEMVAEGNDEASLEARHWVEARYRGQSFELRVPWDQWVEAFHGAHRDRYGYARPDTPVEAVTLRVVVEAPPLPLTPTLLPKATEEASSEEALVFCQGNEIRAQRVWRKDLMAGHRLRGPAIVLEYSSTTWLPPAWTLEVDAWGSLILFRD